MGYTFAHFNFNVVDMEKSIAFYEKALDLKVSRKREADDGSFILAFLEDGSTSFQLELTWLKDHPEAYDLGECEYHLAIAASDYDAAYALHKEMDCICYENKAMGIYFINDPDGYWIEIIPAR